MSCSHIKQSCKLHKKGAVELSAGFLVLLILSLTVFGIGIMLVSQIFTAAENVKRNLDEQTASQIRATLKENNIVTLPFNRLTIDRKGYDVTGVGILNKMGKDATFYLGVQCNAMLGKDDVVLCDENEGLDCDTEATGFCSSWITVDSEGVLLSQHEDAVTDIFISVPANAPSGNYVFNVKVCPDDPTCGPVSEQYGTLKKLYVAVP